MQVKNYKFFKYAVIAAVFSIICSLSLIAGTSSAQENEKKDQDKSAEEIKFDSCDKKDIRKCDKQTKTPDPDYSKFIK